LLKWVSLSIDERTSGQSMPFYFDSKHGSFGELSNHGEDYGIGYNLKY